MFYKVKIKINYAKNYLEQGLNHGTTVVIIGKKYEKTRMLISIMSRDIFVFSDACILFAFF